jgi:ribosome-associated protein
MMEEEKTIRLDQYMKWMGLVLSGGEAKHLIREGSVMVNGEVETRRSKKLRPGDEVTFQEQTFTVELDENR